MNATIKNMLGKAAEHVEFQIQTFAANCKIVGRHVHVEYAGFLDCYSGERLACHLRTNATDPVKQAVELAAN